METKIFLTFYFLSLVSYSCSSELWCSDVSCTSTKKNLLFLSWKKASNYKDHKTLWQKATDLTKDVYQRSNTNFEIDCENRKDVCLRYTNDQEQAYIYQIEDMPTSVAKPVNWLQLEAYVMEVYGPKVQRMNNYTEFKTECPVVWPKLTGIEANPKNFEDEKKCGHVFVNFHQPTCTHCKKIKVFWNALVSHYRSKCLKFLYFKCETEEEMKICRENGALGFPTINKYQDGAFVEEYEGNESMAEFKKFLDDHLAVKAKCSACPQKVDEILEALN